MVDRDSVRALVECALPGGAVLPAPDDAVISRAMRWIDALPTFAQRAYSAGLVALDAAAFATKGRRFYALSPAARLEALDAMERSEATHNALRGLLAPLKLARFDDPEVFARLGCRVGVEAPRAAEAHRWLSQITDAAEIPADEALECDAVIVGTGAGGAPIAYELAGRGHAVLMVEEGRHYTREQFNGRAMDMLRLLYREHGLTHSVGNTVIPIPLGKGVGGTTLVNSGTCFRLPESVLRDWRAQGLTDFTESAMDRWYAPVERMLGVGPSSAAALGAPARLVAKGCDALGYSHHALDRNAPGCDGQGFCCFGCPTDAKRSTNVSYVPAALERGAQLVTGLRVDQVLVRRGAAVGVSGLTRDGARVTVRAKVVVLSCGALLTPALLAAQGLANNSGQLGENLSIHPASAALAVFDERVDPSRTVPQGYAIDHFTGEGLYFEGATTPLDLTAATVPGHGPEYVSLMERFDRTFNFGFMVKDRSRGSVTAGRDGRPRVRYWMNDQDLATAQRGFAILARVLFAAGAREVRLPVFRHEVLRDERDVARLERARLSARHIDFTAYHPLGTARMGTDPLRSVVDATHETHDVHDLFVCDGSAVPSALGVNPQLTIMALALRAAEFVHRRLERRALAESIPAAAQ